MAMPTQKTRKLNTPATLFNVASVGKQFTTYSILLLENQGRLKTSDFVSHYVGPSTEKNLLLPL